MHNIRELNNIDNICKTCNLEKIEIVLADKKRNLNKRQELFYTWPHYRQLYSKLNVFIGFFIFCFCLFNFTLLLFVKRNF